MRGHTNPMALLLLAVLVILGACGGENAAPAAGAYTLVTPEEAREMMAAERDLLILDVRRQDEYAAGHIPGAMCLPNEEIGETPPEALPDPDRTILVYCRSGNRSRQAAEKLAALGYTRVCDMGGIQDWPGDVVTGTEEQEVFQ